MVADLRKQAVSSSAASAVYEARYRHLFEASTEGILIADGATGSILDINPAFTRLSGYERDQLVGLSLPESRLFLHSSTCQGILAELRRQDTLQRNNISLRNRSGRAVDTQLSCSTYRETSGSVIYFSLRDTTAGKRHEALLLGQKRVLEMLAAGEALRDVLTALTQVIEGQSEGVMGAFMVRHQDQARFRAGVAPSLPATYMEVMGQAPIAAPYFGPCAMAADRGESIGTADIASDRRWSREWQQLALEHGLCTCYSSPIFSSSGSILGSFGLYQCGLRHAEPPDPQLLITATHLAGIAIERRQVEKTLRDSDKRKGEFLALLSHELRNPLAAIRNAVYLLQYNSADKETIPTTCGILERQVGQMVRLVDDLLEVGRISRGKVRLNRQTIDVQSVVQQAVEALASGVSAMQHDLLVSYPEQRLYVNGDACRLSQVVGNLLDNACKYTASGGRITVQVAAEDGQAAVRIRDTGIGINADELSSIFDLFTQLDASLDRSNKGLGIGLTLVKSLVEMHDGSVEVSSAGRNCGSEFVVRLPLQPEPKYSRQTPAEPTEQAPLRVLIVDDEIDAASSLAMLLNLSGHETRTVHQSLSAVAATQSFKPDIVLLDLGMPHMNGYQVAQALRKEFSSSELTLIALTGWGQEQDRQRSRDAGFDGHLVKPVEYALLTRTIAELEQQKKAASGLS